MKHKFILFSPWLLKSPVKELRYLSVCSLIFCYLSEGEWSFSDGVDWAT